MDNQHLFNFKTNLSGINIPKKINNPFGSFIPEIAQIAAKEFQEFITLESQEWRYDFSTQKGKMFGVLVVQKTDDTYVYLGTNSGKLPGNATCNNFVPSTFDMATDDHFISEGMTTLTEMGKAIKDAITEAEIIELTKKRKEKSVALQQRLFENYQFLNIWGKNQNVIEIFKNSSDSYPPSAAGECAAPKLLQYAFKQHLKPIALAEFWWGSPSKNKERTHQVFYPACKDKCRPILEYMLDDRTLFEEARGV